LKDEYNAVGHDKKVEINEANYINASYINVNNAYYKLNLIRAL